MELLSITSGGTRESTTLTNQRPEHLVVYAPTPGDIKNLSVEDQQYGNIVRLAGNGVQSLGLIGQHSDLGVYVLPLGDGQAGSTVTISCETISAPSGNVKIYGSSTEESFREQPIIYQTFTVVANTEIDFTDFFAIAYDRANVERVTVTGSGKTVTSLLDKREIDGLMNLKGAYSNASDEIIDNTDQAYSKVTVQAGSSDVTVKVARLKV